MISPLEQIIPGIPVLESLRQLAGEDQQIYLVGGMVRDQLMQQPGHDLDFAVTGDVLRLARKTADQLGAAFYVMDAERQTARLILHSPDSRRWLLDFSALRGNTIQADLFARDFTINAIAIDLRELNRLIDPLNGAQDIKDHVLRMCAPTAFSDDPLRVVRAVRQSAEFGMRMTPDTIAALKKAIYGLEQVSVERQRDELFRILDGEQALAGLRTGFALGVFRSLLPEMETLVGLEQGPPHLLNAFEHTLALISALETLYSVLVEPYKEEKGSNLTYGQAVMELGRYREQLAAHFNQKLNPERSLRGLLLFAGLFHDTAKPLTRSVDPDGRIRFLDHENVGVAIVTSRARALALSTEEVDRLGLHVRHHMRIHHLAKTSPQVSRKALYRYFHDLGEAGVEVVLLAMADLIATYGVTINPERWQAELSVCRQLLDAWYDHREEYLQPARLLDGSELMLELDLSPGPQVGALLDALREAQAAGLVTTRDQALGFARERLTTQNEG